MSEDILLKAFEIHHHQLEKRRDKIMFMSRASTASFIAISGAIAATSEKISSQAVWVVIVGIIFFSLSICLKLYYDGRAYREIASVIGSLNNELKLFELGIYPDRWRKAVNVNAFQTVSHHCLLVFASAILCTAFLYQYG